jgi:hypothetical protein
LGGECHGAKRHRNCGTESSHKNLNPVHRRRSPFLTEMYVSNYGPTDKVYLTTKKIKPPHK